MFLTSGYQITQPPTYPGRGPYHWGVSDESTLCPYALLATICQEKTLYIEKMEIFLLYLVAIKTYLEKTSPKIMSEMRGSLPHPFIVYRTE